MQQKKGKNKNAKDECLPILLETQHFHPPEYKDDNHQVIQQPQSSMKHHKKAVTEK